MYQEVKQYLDNGWRIVPNYHVVNGVCQCPKGKNCSHPGKHPRIRDWTKKASTDTKTVTGWLHKWCGCNIGIATGIDSGIIAIDIDPRNGGDASWNALISEHGDIHTPTIKTGGGGLAVLLVHPGGQVTGEVGVLPGIDIRADGSQIIVPPSGHTSGNHYKWMIGADTEIAECPDWVLRTLLYREYRDDREYRANRVNRANRSNGGRGQQQHLPILKKVAQIIQQTLPTGAGQRNRAIFNFAQGLKGIDEFGEAKAHQLRAYVKMWHEKAKPVIGTKPFEDTLSDFNLAWPRIRHPGGFDVNALAEKAKDKPPHPICAELGYESPQMALLVNICEEVADSSGVFYLACRTAGELIGTSHITAANYLNLLVADEVLAVAKESTKKMARRYRFLAQRRQQVAE